MELCFLFISPCFSFNGQNYILFTAEPRTRSLLLLHAETLNIPLDLLFPKGISQVEGCESLGMQRGALEPCGLSFPGRGPLQTAPEVPLWSSSSRVPPAAELGANSSCHRRDERLPAYINIQPFSVDSFAFLINRHAVIFQVSHLGLTDVPGFFLGPLLEGEKGGNILN